MLKPVLLLSAKGRPEWVSCSRVRGGVCACSQCVVNGRMTAHRNQLESVHLCTDRYCYHLRALYGSLDIHNL